MRSIEEPGWSIHDTEGRQPAKSSPKKVVSIESPLHCAYNQTRECFLGLEVTATEFSYMRLAEMLSRHALKSGEGLWLRPFHGIPTSGIYAPLDLIYLDENCRVIEAVESFPTFMATNSNLRAASILILPSHSIYSSQTQAGDQLVLCVAEEMEKRLEQLSRVPEEPDVVKGAVLLREHPLWSGGPGIVELEGRTETPNPDEPQPHEMSLIEPGVKAFKPPKSWLQRWWSPDPRKAPREPAPGLAAYYWNGMAPQAHSIRDISASGLYVVTEERWYPGTLVLMTLQRNDVGEEIAERSIQVLSRAIRWGNDGVGLQFVLQNDADIRRGVRPLMETASKKAFARFLEQLHKGK